jgi:S-adenosylmethionine decarboxylase
VGSLLGRSPEHERPEASASALGRVQREDRQVKSVGRHLILELWGCRNLNSTEVVEQALRDVVRACDLTLLDLNVYPFTPIGVTGVAVVTESHVMVHTWPEYGYAAVDVFTCGEQANPEAAVPALRTHFEPERIQVMEITRGLVGQEFAPIGAATAGSLERART